MDNKDSKKEYGLGWVGNNDDEQVTRRSVQVDVVASKKALLAQEDKDGDGKITIDDNGPKSFSLRSVDGVHAMKVTGTYHLSNLLQELALAEDSGHRTITLEGATIAENPVDRIQRRIETKFWDALTRRMDESTIIAVAKDTKDRSDRPRPRIYVPSEVQEQCQYYQDVAKQHPELDLDVCILPPRTNEPWDLRAKSGILAMDMEYDDSKLRGLQYTVPGHRFNELYGWDTYFASLGLLQAGKVDIVQDIIHNFVFQIEHYGAVLNANRSYYLGRSHPPFLTDLVIRTYKHTKDQNAARGLLRKGITAAIKEYHRVWMSSPRLDPVTGLSRYRANQHGVPPEVEAGHFDWILKTYADKAGMAIDELTDAYNDGSYQNAELDRFLEHDGAVRESGHDNSYRTEGQCADLATVDLNSLLYMYETQIASTISNEFEDHLELPPSLSNLGASVKSSSYWLEQAAKRKDRMNKYLWDSKSAMFRDYNTASEQQTLYESITTFWTLWSRVATAEQAEQMVSRTLPKFEEVGGAVSTTQRADVRPRQWDYPFGWAPHQITLWDGLSRYGYHAEARKFAYRWLYLITRIAVDYNGTITEKYDVTRLKRGYGDDVEYGNLGTGFEGVPREGFGWTNASYTYGLELIGEGLRKALRRGYRWEDLSSEIVNPKL